ATWTGSVSDWNIATNWSPAGVPTGTAIFAATGLTSVTLAANTSIDTIQFEAGSPAYAITVVGATFDINGSGIVNSSGNIPGISNNGTVRFNNTSSAADADITNFGSLLFADGSSAGSSTIDAVGTGSHLDFAGTSTAGSAAISVTSGTLSFGGTSTAGSAAIDNAFGTVSFDGS